MRFRFISDSARLFLMVAANLLIDSDMNTIPLQLAL